MQIRSFHPPVHLTWTTYTNKGKKREGKKEGCVMSLVRVYIDNNITGLGVVGRANGLTDSLTTVSYQPSFPLA